VPATLAGYPLEQLEPSAPPPASTPARIIADATAEAQRIREIARAEGHEEGRALGREEGVTQTHAAALALHEALCELERRREEIAQAVERDAVELALALAAKIVAGTLEIQPERVLDTVAGALRRIADRRRIAVLVDPADLEVVAGAIGELQARAGGIELCEIQADRRVGRGGAIVRTLESEVDASVQTQLDRAREVVRAELGCDEPTHRAQAVADVGCDEQAPGKQAPRAKATGAKATGAKTSGAKTRREQSLGAKASGEQAFGEQIPGEALAELVDGEPCE
jgi:flagellar biosynthesis/type III secretory pathway protein FliH